MLLLVVGTAGAAGAAVTPAREASAPDTFFQARSRGVEELAASLNVRERGLERRETEIATREADLRAAETRLTERLGELQATRAQLEEMLAQMEEEREGRVRGLVRMVESVRAKEAAPIMQELDDQLAVEVLERMNRTKAGKLLAAMAPPRAARLADQMVGE